MDVVHQDRHLLVVNKPPGLLAQADRTGDPDVLSLGKAYLKAHAEKEGAVYLGLVHRLDRPASGLMVLARTSKAARRLSKQFRERLPEKRYLAIVEGRCEGWDTCTDFLVKENRQVRVVQAEHPGAKYAELTWQALARAEGLSLLLVRLKTGRPHQIRVQLATRGFPILGDLRYGAAREMDGRNLALHAYHLRLEHPVRRKGVAWTVPPPEAWGGRFREGIARLLDQMRRPTTDDRPPA